MGIENRIHEAVLLVLAGCAPATPTTKGTDRTAIPGDAAEPQFAVDPHPNPTAVDAKAICEAHRTRVTVDASRAKAPYLVDRVDENFLFDAHRSIVQCWLVRAQAPSQFDVMRTPTCCPQRGRQQCPPAYKTTAPVTKFLVERVYLAVDGTIKSQELSNQMVETHPEPRHNCGRRPEGMRVTSTLAGDTDACEIARMAELEAASIPAFERLARELAHHGAPDALVRAARDAMLDEIGHAAAIRALAIAHGVTPREVSVPELPIRSLVEIAHENVTEGCVREAFGAVIATYQAACAHADLRATFAAIAIDERAHAALAAAVDAWIRMRLDGAECAALDAAHRAEVHALRADLASTRSSELLGLPCMHTAAALADAYFA
jgi:hypothetical protein